MRRVESYAAGAWHRPSDEGALLRDAATGEAFAQVSSAGVDVEDAVEHGRAVGGQEMGGMRGVFALGARTLSSPSPVDGIREPSDPHTSNR